MDFTARCEALEERTRTYAGERWLKDHHEANACVRLERLLTYGIWLYGQIAGWEKFWASRVATGHWPYREAQARLIAGVWDWWQKPCTSAEAAIEHFRSLGFDVAPAEEFLACCVEAAGRDVMEDLADIAEIHDALEDPERMSHDQMKKALGRD